MSTESSVPPHKQVNNPYGLDLDSPELRAEIQRFLDLGYPPDQLIVSQYGSVDYDPDIAEREAQDRVFNKSEIP